MVKLKQTTQIVQYLFEIMIFVAKKHILDSKCLVWVYCSDILHRYLIVDDFYSGFVYKTSTFYDSNYNAHKTKMFFPCMSKILNFMYF